MRKKKFIEGIHNYCDRWCERCPLTTRCAIFRPPSDKSKEAWNEAEIIQKVAEDLKEALDLLREFAEERGIDLDASPDKDPEPVLEPAKIKAIHSIEAMARHYGTMVETWFNENQTYFEAREHELNTQLQMDLPIDMPGLLNLKDALEEIQWYYFFIGAKVHRAISGLTWNEFDDIDRIQNDANGSAKSALLAIDQSLKAWEITRRFFLEKTDELLDIFVLLRRLRRDLLAQFPHAYSFIRPGFDEKGGKKSFLA
ncbi:MAG: hypothetical protein RL329_1599 [Bacteroidota bacterium]